VFPEHRGAVNAGDARGRRVGLAHPVDRQRDHRVRESALHRLGGVDGELPAAVQHDQAVEAFGLVEVRGAHHHRGAVRHHLVHDQPQVAARDGIDAEGGLVEQQDGGLVHQAARQREFLLHAPGELAGQPALERTQRREVVEALKPLRTVRARHAVQVGVELEILGHGEVGVEAEALRHVGDRVLHPLGIPHHAHALEAGVAVARLQHPGQHAQRGGLAGPVGAHQPEQLTAPHRQRQGIDRHECAEASCQPLQLDDRGLRIAHAGFSRRTSAGMPGLRSKRGSSVTRTLTAYTSFTRSSLVCTFLGVNSASLLM